ncbi:MAG: hypothetical protein GXP08_16950 [Gammaproteobacteria bacterium]|nr:hypothetical protein [Gammaproteobacteria bacterium]
MVIMDDSEANYALSSPITLDNGTWVDIFVTAGDYDGNGTVDLMLGLIDPTKTSATIKMIENSNNLSYAFNGTSITINQKNHSISQLILVTGNLDYDAPEELAIVVTAGFLTSSANGLTSNVETWYYHL